MLLDRPHSWRRTKTRSCQRLNPAQLQAVTKLTDWLIDWLCVVPLTKRELSVPNQFISVPKRFISNNIWFFFFYFLWVNSFHDECFVFVGSTTFAWLSRIVSSVAKLTTSYSLHLQDLRTAWGTHWESPAHPWPSFQSWTCLTPRSYTCPVGSVYENPQWKPRAPARRDVTAGLVCWTTLAFSEFHVASRNNIPVRHFAPWRRRSCCRRFGSGDFYIPDDRQTKVQSWRHERRAAAGW